MIDKRCPTVAQAVADIPDGATVMIGGFGASGSPIELIHALIDHGAADLTVINNNTGNGEVGLAALIGNGQVRKMICSFPRSSQSRVFPKLYKEGRIELELVPQGTLADFKSDAFQRNLDPDTLILVYRGWVCDLRKLESSIRAAESKAEIWMRTHNRW